VTFVDADILRRSSSRAAICLFAIACSDTDLTAGFNRQLDASVGDGGRRDARAASSTNPSEVGSGGAGGAAVDTSEIGRAHV